MISRRKLLLGSASLAIGGMVASPYIVGRSRPKIRLAGSIYVGWMPWFLADVDGTLARISDEYGVDIEFIRADYGDTLGLYSGGGVDAVVMTNIDAASIVAASNIASDAILVGSFSNGNDAVVIKPDRDGSLENDTYGLVEFSVSHYLLDRLAEQQGLPIGNVKVVNYSDSTIIAAFSDKGNNLDGVVTWNPIVQELESSFQGRILGDSSSINREIADLLVVRRDVLAENPAIADALHAVWFDVAGRLIGEPDDTKAKLGELSGTSAAGYQLQLDKTILLNEREAAIAAFDASALTSSVDPIKSFVLRHGLIDVAPENWISFGDNTNGLLRYNSSYLNK